MNSKYKQNSNFTRFINNDFNFDCNNDFNNDCSFSYV